MRGVFLGTPSCAIPTLEALVDAGHDVPLVVTQPDRAVGRSRTPRPTPVKAAAERLGIEVVQPSKLRTAAFVDRLRVVRPDVLVVVAYGRILSRTVLQVPRLAPVNVHFSMLPRHRGAAPVQWALAHGDSTTGVTTMRMSEALDEGDVFLQEETRIDTGEHAPALLDRLADLGASLLIATLDGIESGALTPWSQDPGRATYAPSLRREDGVADFSLPAREIEGRVRGFDPWPGVWARRRGKRLRIVQAETVVGEPVLEPPGRVLTLRGALLGVACGGGTVLGVRAVQPEGRKIVASKDAVNGRQLLPGDDLVGEE